MKNGPDNRTCEGSEDGTPTKLDKTYWETEKLRLETRNFEDPFRRQPVLWLTICTLLLSLGGSNVTHMASRTLAENSPCNSSDIPG